MIKEKCFTSEWLKSFKKQEKHQLIQTNILEKMIYALHLLEQLKSNGLDFIFKGGTSLIFLLDEDNRFSIDIDIICNAEQKALEDVLNKVIKTSYFNSFTLDKKRSYQPGVPKAHYIFEFETIFNTKAPAKIILDVLVDKHIYPEIINKSLKTKWIETDTTTMINLPSIDAITGDKLAAYAPNTTGIPYYKGEQTFAMEICKQLFDLGRLFERISSIETVNNSFQLHAKKEITYRQYKTAGDLTPEIVLEDIIDTCRIITKRDKNKEEPAKSNFRLLQDGIHAFSTGYLMTGKFRIDDAIIAAAKVAHLASKLLVGDLTPINYYNGVNIRPLTIEYEDWNFLNRLKKQPDKSAFYYWYHTVNLLKQQQ